MSRETSQRLKKEKKMREIYNMIIGIDPGEKGAVSVTLLSSSHKTQVFKISDPEKLPENFIEVLIKRNREKKVMVFLERVNGMPIWGYKNFAFGYNYGLWRGFFVALGVPVTLVSPKTWKAVMGVSGEKQSRADSKTLTPKEKTKAKAERTKVLKALAIEKAKELYGESLSDGEADSLLIMEYGRRTLEEEGKI